MAEDDEVFEIYLPQNKITEEFSSKSNVEKTRIIELGLSTEKGTISCNIGIMMNGNSKFQILKIVTE